VGSDHLSPSMSSVLAPHLFYIVAVLLWNTRAVVAHQQATTAAFKLSPIARVEQMHNKCAIEWYRFQGICDYVVECFLLPELSTLQSSKYQARLKDERRLRVLLHFSGMSPRKLHLA
jgi:hypothetical protein